MVAHRMTAQRPRLICLMGPTASGKTGLAIELAAARDCELISVDSVLVYRGLDIGSAKPAHPHHLIDIRDAAQVYSAADFAADATRLAAQITARGKTPLLVGGTMLYFRALLEGLAQMPGADRDIRREIETEAALRGWPYMHAQLAQVDPRAAARIHPNHSQRLCRALEVYRASGIPLSTWHQRSEEKGTDPFVLEKKTKGSVPFSAAPAALETYDIVQLAICPADRAVLHRRIARRFEAMMAAGFLDEVRGLWRRGDLNAHLPAIRAVGYRQLWQYLEGECSLEQAVERGIAASRQLAKRQLTWLRKWPDLAWIYTDSAGNLCAPGRSHLAVELLGQKPLQQALNYLDPPPL